MFVLVIDDIEEPYESIDNAMNDLFQIYPDASFGPWNDSCDSIWQDIYENNTERTIIIGKIYEKEGVSWN